MVVGACLVLDTVCRLATLQLDYMLDGPKQAIASVGATPTSVFILRDAKGKESSSGKFRW